MRGLVLFFLTIIVPLRAEVRPTGALQVWNLLGGEEEVTFSLDGREALPTPLQAGKASGVFLRPAGISSLLVKRAGRVVASVRLKIEPSKGYHFLLYKSWNFQTNQASLRSYLWSPPSAEQQDSQGNDAPLRLQSLCTKALRFSFNDQAVLLHAREDRPLKQVSSSLLTLCFEGQERMTFSPEQGVPHLLVVWSEAPGLQRAALLFAGKFSIPPTLREDGSFGSPDPRAIRSLQPSLPQ